MATTFIRTYNWNAGEVGIIYGLIVGVFGCLGVLFGVIRWRTGNTTAAMVTHAAINFAAASFGTAMVVIAAYGL